MMCVLEEHGKILNLHRTLYSYTRRKDSISHAESDDLLSVRKENADLMKMIKSRRDNDNLDTLERYFYPVQDGNSAQLPLLFPLELSSFAQSSPLDLHRF
jgi:hypothetical protein